MDPNATLTRIRELILELNIENADAQRAAILELVDLVNALDDWLVAGGFLPTSWDLNRKRAPIHEVVDGEVWS